jgi:Caspase domain/Protein of unknown function (DUF1566)
MKSKNYRYLSAILIFILMITVLTPVHADKIEGNKKRVALVIGNSAYRNTPALRNPLNDAMEIGNALKRLGFNVDIRTDLTKSDMDQALRQFGDRLDGAEVALFFYAGHGLQVAGTNYLVPIDAQLSKERDLHYETVNLSLVMREMEASQRVNLVFLDACRDNPLSKKLAEGVEAGRSLQIGRGLAPISANVGTLISYATRDGDVAADGKGKHSPYTQALLNQMEQPGIEISQMLRKVREDVMKTTDKKQTPWEYGSLLGEFYFIQIVTIPAQPVENLLAKPNMEALFWQSIMTDSNSAVFEAYLKKYPTGEFADIAKLKINDLKKGKEKPSPPVESLSHIDAVSQKPAPDSTKFTKPDSADKNLPAKLEIIDLGKGKEKGKKKSFSSVESPDNVGADSQKSSLNSAKYSKLDSSGKNLPESSTAWNMVRDNDTGLIWEIKENMDGKADYTNPHDADNQYAWYDSNPATNGGNSGIQNQGNNTESVIKALNSAKYGGYSDWRLPTVTELKSLVIPDTKNLTINAAFFPNTQPSWYWSSTTYTSDIYGAWLVNFIYGRDQGYLKNNSWYVRAVRGGR